MTALGGKYRIGERIGGGGMAEVFRAELLGAEGFSRAVAVKRMKRSISSDKEFAKLFIAEARLAARLAHANVVQTLDFSRDEKGCFYLVMELIDGVDLRQLVQSGRVPLTASVFLVAEILRALDYAHEMVSDGQPMTIVHRDISPHNIMLSWQGSVKVVDFGIAKAIAGSLVSRSGSLKGKVAYMSPEQVHGHALDGRSDLFAIGIVLHELVTGERLFVGESEAATLSKLLTQPIPMPSARNDQVPADLDRIVMKLLARDRDTRYLRAHDALQDLLRCSVSVLRGRADLETVLGERFPSRAPQRVPRLSSSAGESAFENAFDERTPVAETLPSAPPEPEAPAPAAESSANDLTLAATPRGVASLLATIPAAPSEGPERELPKRTLTAPAMAEPVDGASASLAEAIADDEWVVGPASHRGRWLVAVGLALVLGVGLFALRGAFEEKSEAPGVKLVAAVPVASVQDAGVTALPATQVMDASAADARREAPSVDADLKDSRATDDRDDEPRTAKKALLTVRVKPWATVTIDGRSYGQTPQTVELGRGKHRVLVENEGLDRRESFSITLRSGQKKLIDKDWR